MSLGEVIFLSSQQNDETTQINALLRANNFTVHHFQTTQQALEFLHKSNPKQIAAVVAKLGRGTDDLGFPLIEATHKRDSNIFVAVFSFTACDDAKLRTTCHTMGAHMVSADLSVLNSAMELVQQFRKRSGTFQCPICKDGAMTEDELWNHDPLYHNQDPSTSGIACPLCGKSDDCYAVHLRNKHGPCGRKELPSESALHVRQTYTFTLMVCRRKKDGRFLLVQEVASWGWWLPGGRTNMGEDLVQSVIRETKEETGIDVKVTGILRMEYTASHQGTARLRAIFFGEPVDENQQPKTIPDFESLGAAWVDVNDLVQLPLRGREPTDWFTYVQKGGVVHPLSLLTHEGAKPQEGKP